MLLDLLVRDQTMGQYLRKVWHLDAALLLFPDTYELLHVYVEKESQRTQAELEFQVAFFDNDEALQMRKQRFKRMKVAKLKDALKKHGLAMTGWKTKLLRRLILKVTEIFMHEIKGSARAVIDAATTSRVVLETAANAVK